MFISTSCLFTAYNLQYKEHYRRGKRGELELGVLEFWGGREGWAGVGSFGEGWRSGLELGVLEKGRGVGGWSWSFEEW
jgi:hypothetical protein